MKLRLSLAFLLCSALTGVSSSYLLTRQSLMQPGLLSAITALFSSNMHAKTDGSKQSPTEDAPSLMPYFQLTVDEKGGTSIVKRDFVDTEVKGYSNTPQIIKNLDPDFATPTNVVFTALSGENPWHHCPAPQIVVCLRGGWYIKTNDGKRVEFHPGDVLYQDNTENHPAAKAAIEHAAQHFSGSLNGEPCDQMIVQLELKNGPIANSKEAANPM